jgi:hypothetical protein
MKDKKINLTKKKNEDITVSRYSKRDNTHSLD